MDINNTLKCIAIIIVVIMVIDLPMILKINKEMYSKNFDDINGLQPSNSFRQIISGIICYLFLGIGIYYFVMDSGSRDISYLELVKRSAIFGLVTYGIYNTTTLVTINQYKLKTAAVDIVWGICLMILTTFISKIIINRFLDVSDSLSQSI